MTQLSIHAAPPDAVQAVKAYVREECYGEESAQTKLEIAKGVGIPVRDVERHVKAARILQNAPIVSGSPGYWWPTHEREIRACRHLLWRHIIEQMRTVRALEHAELDMAGQRHILGGTR